MEQAKKNLPFLVLAAFFLVSRAFFLSHTPYEWDSVNYARALTNFSIPDDQPHPPGSILYVYLGRAVKLLVGDDLKSLLFMNFIFGLAALIACYRLGRIMGGTRRAGALTAFFFTFNPFTWFYGEVAEIYIVEACLSALAGYLMYRFTRDKEEADFLRATILLGLAGGFRMNAEVFLFPLWLVLLLRYRIRQPFLNPVKFLFLLAAVSALWFVPTLVHCNGLAEYSRLSNRTVRSFFEVSSVFYGAPVSAHARMMMKFAAWSAIGAGMLLAGAALLVRVRPSSVPDRKLLGFLAIWAAPALLFYGLVYIAKPGYLLFLFPPLFSLIAVMADRAFPAGPRAWIFAGLLCIPGMLYLFSPGVCGNEIPSQLTPGKSFKRLFRYTLSDVRYGDRRNHAFHGFLGKELLEAKQPVFIFSSFPTWNFRFANHYFPQVESHLLIVSELGVMGEHAQFQYGRIFLARGAAVEILDRDAYLFIHPVSRWGGSLEAQQVRRVGPSDDVCCYYLPAGSGDSIEFSGDSVSIHPVRQERRDSP